MKITDAFQEFINYATLERCLEPTTIDWYQRSIKPFYKYLRSKALPPNLDVLTVQNFRDFFISLRHRGYSSRGLLNLMQGNKAFCNFLVKRCYIPENPFDDLEKPKLARKLPEFLDEEESRKLLKACIEAKGYYKSRKARDIAIIALFLFTGLRKKELLNLRLQDVNFDRGYIKVFAKNKERLIPLNETARDYLAEYLKLRPKREGIDNIFVSTNRKASALTGQGLYDVFRELKKTLGFSKKFSPQILRHTFCTLMLRNGVNIRDIQLLAGHSDISTTARFYLGCDEKQLKQAVERHPLNI